MLLWTVKAFRYSRAPSHISFARDFPPRGGCLPANLASDAFDSLSQLRYLLYT